MIKRLVIGTMIFLLAGCTNIGLEEHPKAKEATRVMLDVLIEEDDALNDGMEYIALEPRSLNYLETSKQEEVHAYLEETYNVEVFEATIEALFEDEERNEEDFSLNGIHLTLENIQFDESSVHFEGAKFASRIGSFKGEGSLNLEDGEWRAGRFTITAMS